MLVTYRYDVKRGSSAFWLFQDLSQFLILALLGIE